MKTRETDTPGTAGKTQTKAEADRFSFPLS